MSSHRKVCLLVFLLIFGGVSTETKYCSHHQIKDYCWLEEKMPDGGNGLIDE